VATVALILLFRPGSYSISSPVGGRLAVTRGERSMILTGSLLMSASMLAWVGAAHWVNLPLVILGLVLSGLAMGLASPSYTTLIAGSVDPADMGVANGMGATMMNIGMLTGIQAMFTVLGDGRQPDDFARVFAFGGVVAALGVTGGLLVTKRPARASHRVEAAMVVTETPTPTG
jgi:MFS family permease